MDLLNLDPDDIHVERAILRIAEKDPGFSARLVGLANSAAYFKSKKNNGPICAVAQAIQIIGITATLETGVAHYLSSSLPPADIEARTHRVALWRHSLLVGFAARELAKEAQPSLSTVAFSAGLMHDIGLLVLEHVNFTGYQQVMIAAQNQGCSPEELEQRMLGVSHPELGDILANAWHLPPGLVSVIGQHHNSEMANALTNLITNAELETKHPYVATAMFSDLPGDYKHLCSSGDHEDPSDRVTKLAEQVAWVIGLSSTFTSKR
jgi:HD-like signal output (HDOD) protein